MHLILTYKSHKINWFYEMNTIKEIAETPLMKQYNQIKARHPDALLLFRVGDFYETFGEDAVRTSRILGIILTKRKNGSGSDIELAGFPYHSLDVYLPRLVRAGLRVAICDQLEDPKLTKTIVKRGVTELVTPGVAFNDQVLLQKENNFLCAIHFEKAIHGVAFLDVSTGEFLIGQGDKDYVDKLIAGFSPSEFLYARKDQELFKKHFGDHQCCFRIEDWVYTSENANERLNKHFKTNSLKGFGVNEMNVAIIAAGAALYYLSENQHKTFEHITNLSRISASNYVWLDRFTIRNLELVSTPHENATTLLNILDKTLTPMGGRLMKRWLIMPLKKLDEIRSRHDVVEWLKNDAEQAEELSSILNQIGDLERLISKVAVGKINPREVAHLKKTMINIPKISLLLEKNKALASLQNIEKQLNNCMELVTKIAAYLDPEPGVQVGKGRVIREGYDVALDELRNISLNGKDYLDKLQEREAIRTGITSLKISFNNVFGYYIEVRNTHKDKVPEEWIRRQTLVNAERYITDELKEYESKILGAEDKIYQIEARLFSELVAWLADFIKPIQQNAAVIAKLDCLHAFAFVARKNNYARAEMNDGLAINIHNGRHPVIEQQLPHGNDFIANDIFLDNDTQQIIMITGPNMSGKSALLRQTALIVLMAQMGSFVPAEKAEIGWVDKVFTRVGASDNISSGESTFMVEMNETASILNNISDRSLLLLDEIGRGTSTYDGVSIAWSIAEFLHENKTAQCKTLFATHYHELNEMASRFNRIKNYTIAVKEVANSILFLRKLIPGGSEHSFGIHVAKMAGMPNSVVKRAEEVLKELELSHANMGENNKSGMKPIVKKQDKGDSMQLSFFQLNDPVLENIHDELMGIDINTLTPVEALIKLNDIKKLIGG